MTNKSKRAKAVRVPNKFPVIKRKTTITRPSISGWKYLKPGQVAEIGDFCWRDGSCEWNPVTGIEGFSVRDDGFVAADYIVIRRQPKRGGGR